MTLSSQARRRAFETTGWCFGSAKRNLVGRRINQNARPSDYNRNAERRHDNIWVLVLVPILAIPFENQFTIAGLSLAKLTIIPLLVAVVVFRYRLFLNRLRHSLFLLSAVFLSWGALLEAFHPASDWEFLYRILQMFVFGALVGSVLPNARIMKRILLGLLLVCSLLALYLIANFYGRVNVSGLNSLQADQLRFEAFKDMSLEVNLNMAGYTVGMGAVVAFSRLLEAKKHLVRCFWGGFYLLCVIGATSTVSRGAFVAVAVASCLMFWRSSRKSLTTQKLVFAVVATMAAYALLPQTLVTRLGSTADMTQDAALAKQEARQRIYTAAID